MLHNARYKHVGTVGNNVHLKLLACHILIDEHGIVYSLCEYALHIYTHLVLIVDNLHILSAYYIGRAQQHRISELPRRFKRFFEGIDAEALRTLYTEFLKQLVKSFSVLGYIDSLS